MNSTSIDNNFVNNSINSDIDTLMPHFTDIEVIVIILVTGIMSFVIITGNLLIMIAYGINKKLRVMNNYFLVSLSIADFLIGVLVIPFYTTYVLIGNWTGTIIGCDLWLSLDYGLTTSSTLHLLLISLDRYLAVKYPLVYRVHRRSRKVLFALFVVWIISFTIWMPPIFAMSRSKDGLPVPTIECMMPYVYSNDYLVIVIINGLTFWFPVITMVGFYRTVYAKVLKHNEFISKHVTRHSIYVIGNEQTLTTMTCNNPVAHDDTILHTFKMNSSSICLNTTRKDKYFDKNRVSTSSSDVPSASSDTSIRFDNYKAAKTLSAILLAFLITWTPWQIYIITSYFCKQCVPIAFYYFGKYLLQPDFIFQR